MAGLSAAMEEPAIARTRRSLRSDLQLVALILSIAAWDASVVLVGEIARKPIAFDWLPRLGHLVLGGLLCVGPGVLAVRLLSPGYPATLRGCVRTFAVFVLGSTIGHWLAFRWVYASPSHAMDMVLLPSAVAWSLLTYALGAASIVGAMYWWRRGSVIRQELHRTRVGLLALQADRAEAELMRLRTQVEPHFLFNTVATVVQLVRSDAAAAHRTLARLIDYMSASRAHMRREETTLAEELRLTEGYLEIQRLRMEARLRYAIDVAPDLRGNRIPPAAVLTLVENAIKHGLAPRKCGGALRIAAHREGGWLVVSVADDGVGLRTVSGRGSGLANVRARIQGLYGADAWLRLASAAEGGTTATMRLPAGAPPAAAAS
jgi:signal transduction histidine kinase